MEKYHHWKLGLILDGGYSENIASEIKFPNDADISAVTIRENLKELFSKMIDSVSDMTLIRLTKGEKEKEE